MSTPTVRVWYAIVVAFFAMVLIAVAGVGYTNRVQRQSDQRWCALWVALDPQGAPPTNERGRVVAAEIQRLRREFRCPPPGSVKLS